MSSIQTRRRKLAIAPAAEYCCMDRRHLSAGRRAGRRSCSNTCSARPLSPERVALGNRDRCEADRGLSHWPPFHTARRKDEIPHGIFSRRDRRRELNPVGVPPHVTGNCTAARPRSWRSRTPCAIPEFQAQRTVVAQSFVCRPVSGRINFCRNRPAVRRPIVIGPAVRFGFAGRLIGARAGASARVAFDRATGDC